MSDTPFTLSKEISGLALFFDAALGQWQMLDRLGAPQNITAYSPGNEWVEITTNTFLAEEVLDVAGLSSDERTLFFASQLLQQNAAYLSNGIAIVPTGGAEVVDVVVVSDVPLADALGVGGALPNSMNAGFNNSADNFSNTKFGRGVTYVQSTSAPNTMTPSDSWNFGSGDPTASDKLYLYRWIVISANAPVNSDLISVPAVRYVTSGISSQEPGNVYINRLRLSYEQQTRA